MDDPFWFVANLFWIIPLMALVPGLGVPLFIMFMWRRTLRDANAIVVQRMGPPGPYRAGRPGSGHHHASSWSDDSATAHAGYAAHGAGGHGAPHDHGWHGSHGSGWSSSGCSDSGWSSGSSDSGSSSSSSSDSSSSDSSSSSSSSSSSDSGSSSC